MVLEYEELELGSFYQKVLNVKKINFMYENI